MDNSPVPVSPGKSRWRPAYAHPASSALRARIRDCLRIHLLSSEALAVQEGLLYPTLQKMLVKEWVTADWGISETNRKVRFYRLTAAGRKQLAAEVSGYERLNSAIQEILRTA
jgi:hypothetical protein